MNCIQKEAAGLNHGGTLIMQVFTSSIMAWSHRHDHGISCHTNSTSSCFGTANTTNLPAFHLDADSSLHTRQPPNDGRFLSPLPPTPPPTHTHTRHTLRPRLHCPRRSFIVPIQLEAKGHSHLNPPSQCCSASSCCCSQAGTAVAEQQLSHAANHQTRHDSPAVLGSHHAHQQFQLLLPRSVHSYTLLKPF